MKQRLFTLLLLGLYLASCTSGFDSSSKSSTATGSGINPGPITLPAPPLGKAGYPFYMPMENLIEEPQFIYEISCSLSNAAGELRTKDNQQVAMPNAEVYTGTTFIYEAPCTYVNMAPGTVRNWKWADGAQVIHKTSVRGQKAVFVTNDVWHTLQIRPGALVGYKLDNDGKPTGQLGGRFHTEVIDIDFYNTSESPQPIGALHFEVYPQADSGSLATLVVRDSRFRGCKNALFMPSGAVMLYAENTEFGSPHGNNVDQEHAVYINGILNSHFNNVKIYGDRASGSFGGHQLKVKAGIVVMESVTLDNGGGDYDPSNRPLYDGAAQAYVWSEDLTLNRVTADMPRDALVDLRRTAYPSSGLRWPMPTAAGADMAVAAPGCSKIKPEYDEYYMQVFKDTVVNSEVSEKSVFRNNGFFDTVIGSSDGDTSYAEIIANPRRNRSWLFTFNTNHPARMVTEDAYYYLQPAIPTYHCENPILPTGLNALIESKEKFITYALKRFELANPGMYKIINE